MKSLDLETRILDAESAAAYLGVSLRTVKSYVKRGIIPRVVLPAQSQNSCDPLMKILIDKKDLDSLIEHNKEIHIP
jgi:predicted site-specific integrase-resolvase